MFERSLIQERAVIDDVTLDFASFAGPILFSGRDLRDVRWLVARRGHYRLSSFITIFHW